MKPRVEILSFEGCPNRDPTHALVERIAAELRVEPEIELVEVPDADAAVRLRFLGSPTVRVNGRDVEPGADERRDFVLACRIYRSGGRFAGQPDDVWIRAALATSDDAGREKLPPRVADVLATAKIPPSKLGRARHERLAHSERDLYFWILCQFAASGRPSSAAVRTTAGRLGLDVERALKSLVREDLVHLGQDGEIAVAYPFSGRETAHRVRFQSGREAYAMCAIDALGIAAMFHEPIDVASEDPLTGDEICGRLPPDGTGVWRPASAVVVAGAIERDCESFRGCCPVLNFFASTESAARWLGQHPAVSGKVISIRDAVAAGRAVFADVFQ